MRIEARNARGRIDTVPFDRLAGRINALQTLYSLLSTFGKTDEIDLGSYLSEIVSSVMRAHAVEGVSLDLKVDPTDKTKLRASMTLAKWFAASEQGRN